MFFLPIVVREMSALSRRRSTYLTRSLTAALAMFVIGWLFLIAIAGLSFAQIGQAIFTGVASISFVYALLVGIHATSDAISEEKREGTLGLLFLTALKSHDITFGKLAATSLNSFYALIAVIPTLSLAILLGGTALADVTRASVVLLNTMFLSLALGMLVSALSVNERRAILASFVTLSVITLGPFLVTLVATEFQSLPAIGLLASPLYPFLCIFDPTIPEFKSDLFYVSLIVQHLLGWAFLYRATRLLPGYVLGVPRNWRDRLAESVDRYVYGSAQARNEHRRRLLDRNPFLWLASRERIKPASAWLFIGIFFSLYAWNAWGFHGILFDLRTSAIILFLVHLVLKFWVTSEVCTRLTQDRRGGALELLLSSPLSIREIAAGQHRALTRIFGGPLLGLVLAEILLLLHAHRFMSKPAPMDRGLTYIAAISSLLLDLWALKWLGMWLSLFGKSIERVLVATVLRVLLAPWIVFLGFGAVFSAFLSFQGRRLEYHELLVVWWSLAFAFSAGFGFFARHHFLRHCREVVADQHETPASLARALVQKSQKERKTGLFVPPMVRRRPMVAGLVILASLVVVALLVRRQYWSFQLAREVAAIKARQEPTTLAEIGRTYPQVTKSEDLFALFAETGVINRAIPRGSTPVNWNNLILTGSNHLHGLTETNREIVATVLTNNSAQLAAFHKVSLFTNAYIDPLLDYRYPVITDLYGYADLAVIDFLFSVNEQNTPRADAAAMRAILYARILRSQPVWHAQYVAATLLDKTSAILETALFQKAISDDALIQLQTLISQIDSSHLARRQLLITRAIALDPPHELLTLRGRDRQLAATLAFNKAIGSWQQQLTQLLQRFDDAIAITASAPHERLAWTANLPNFGSLNQRAYNSLREWHEAQIYEIIVRDVRGLTQVRVLETAIATERYRRKYASYPVALDALVPEFLPSVPIDPFSGDPLQWRNSSEAVLIRSAGPNSKSDRDTSRVWLADDVAFRFWRPRGD